LLNLGAIGDLSDGQLLERFTTRDGEPAELAFAALVERQGPMVLRVCRNLLSDPHDAEDAFQATFLVFVQKARRLWVRDSLAPWLHRVANLVAARARASKRRRREHERRAAESRPTLIAGAGDWEGQSAVLHEEINRLQDRYRSPVVLCHLEGLTHERAARHLGLPVGTVKSRLRRARELLRSRLSRRGLTLPGGLLIAESTSRGAQAALPLSLIDSTVRAAVAAPMSQSGAIGVISASVAELTEEVLRTMFLTKLKMVAVVVLMACALAAGAAGVLAQQEKGPNPAPAVEQPQRSRSVAPRGAPPIESSPAPSFIRQSRTMIITRLERELGVAKDKLERTLLRVRSSSDPEVVRAKKTVAALDDLIARIDTVLVDAVEQYPTIFDFSRGVSDLAPGGSPGGPAPKKPEEAKDRPGADSRDQNNLDRRARDLELSRAQDRVDWAKRMFEKGYVSKSNYEAAVLEHYAALKARFKEQPLSPEDLKNYEALKARFGAQSPQQSAAPQQNQNQPQQNQQNQKQQDQQPQSQLKTTVPSGAR